MTRPDRARVAAMQAAARRTRALAAPNATTRTIARLIAAHVARTGSEPSDAELASTLALAVGRVRRHRALIREMP